MSRNDWSSKVNPNPATVEEQIADLDAHYPGGFEAWYLAGLGECTPERDEVSDGIADRRAFYRDRDYRD